MKKRENCKCPCHSGRILVHVVPCCDGNLASVARWFRSRKKKAAPEQRQRKHA